MGLHCRTRQRGVPVRRRRASPSPGCPAWSSATTQQIAWGFTNLGPDVTDLYLEKVAGRHATCTTAAGQPLDDARRDDQGRRRRRRDDHRPRDRARPAALRRRRRRRRRPARARRSTAAPRPRRRYAVVAAPGPALTPGTHGGRALRLDTAHELDRVPRGGRATSPCRRRTSSTPTPPATSATRRRAGSRSGGPRRRSAPGYWPAPGWDPPVRLDRATCPFDAAAHVATTRPRASSSPPTRRSSTSRDARSSPRDWDYGYRSQRIRDLLAARQPKISPGDMRAIQLRQPQRVRPDARARTCCRSTCRRTRTPSRRSSCCAAGTSPATAAPTRPRRRTSTRSGATCSSSPSTTSSRGPAGRRRRPVVARSWRSCSRTRTTPWWDDKATPGVIEGRDEILREALVEARLDLTSELGKEPGDWQWGQLHRLDLQHQVLGGDGVPGLVRGAVQPRAVDCSAAAASHRRRDRLGRRSRRATRVDRGAVDADGGRPRQPRPRRAGST